VPVLGIVFIVSISHELVVLQDGDPILVFFHLFTRVGGAGRRNELLDCDRMRVEILQRDVGKERNLVIFVELNVDVVLTRSLGFAGDFV
jgi:hypothetical protein